MRIKKLTLHQAEHVAHSLAKEIMDWDEEPIPPFHTRSPGKLESCLEEPFQTFDGKQLHRTFIERAAVMFYLITKNHCFSNGNKRMAVTLTAVFFYVNKRWLNVPPMALYKVAKDVAESRPYNKDKVIAALVVFFKKYEEKAPR